MPWEKGTDSYVFHDMFVPQLMMIPCPRSLVWILGIHLNFKDLHPRSLIDRPWKIMVGRLFYFWDGRCSRAMLNFQEVPSLKLTVSLPLKMGSWETIRLPFGAHPIFEAHIQTYANHGNIILVQSIHLLPNSSYIYVSISRHRPSWAPKFSKNQERASPLLTTLTTLWFGRFWGSLAPKLVAK